MQREISAFATWQSWLDETKQQKLTLSKSLARMLNAEKRRGYLTWYATAQQRARQAHLMNKVHARLVHACALGCLRGLRYVCDMHKWVRGVFAGVGEHLNSVRSWCLYQWDCFCGRERKLEKFGIRLMRGE